ncbi:glycine zipper 2TM domain-containing protein [Vibrio sp. SCSIO 43136]|uniref:glycine zipper 2TM domain-containing protein n=1 Tax=Vibrio sp. SCSIO 43136 TaxID=2819101 RepID=UPI002074D0BE|nr:glycine zipper 2TM domain-containing protein [Vibrio sp. SCSIO 43136]USD66256.1 glycine zipper 2TM domain-containing protein [Vibrio sp. SCSIO 43136]
MRKWLLMLLVIPVFCSAAYQRNQAQPVKEVVFGQIQTVRYITQQEIVESQKSGWNTLAGATIGGLIGNQFGGGHGKEVATVVGALAGAHIASNQGPSVYKVEHKLVELLIETKKDELINVIQDVDRNMLFESGDKVRILYFDGYVRVDRSY